MAPVILLTRPEPDAGSFARMLRERLGEVGIVISPLMRIEVTGPLPPMTEVDGLIFTSRNGIRAYSGLNGPKRPCYCVGKMTADMAREAGLAVVGHEEDAAALEARIAADGLDGRWMHLHGEHVRRDIAKGLRARGFDVAAQPIYRQLAQQMTAEARAHLAGDAPVILPVFSPRSAKLLGQGDRPRAPLYIVAMSDAVAEALPSWPRTKCCIADHPDAASMLEATIRAFDAAGRVEGGERGQ